MNNQNTHKHTLAYTIISIVLLILFFVLLFALFPLLKSIILNWNNQQEMANQIYNYGWRGVALLLALQFIQSMVFFIPTAPVQILTGLCYGKFYGTLIALTGFSIANLVLFILLREFFHIFEPFFKST